MREILFRGKRVDNEEWIEGFYSCLGENIHYILTGKLTITYGIPLFESFEIIPTTVGQYTGLTDKNGKKIFEGDIAVGASRTPHIIKIGRHCSEAMKLFFSACKINEKHYAYGAYAEALNGIQCDIEENDIIEVIGNRWDNPELLEK